MEHDQSEYTNGKKSRERERESERERERERERGRKWRIVTEVPVFLLRTPDLFDDKAANREDEKRGTVC